MNTPGTQLYPVQAGGEAERGMEMGGVCARASAEDADFAGEPVRQGRPLSVVSSCSRHTKTWTSSASLSLSDAELTGRTIGHRRKATDKI